MHDNIARFTATFDSECQGCGVDIEEEEDMGFDKDTQEYICSSCIEGRT